MGSHVDDPPLRWKWWCLFFVIFVIFTDDSNWFGKTPTFHLFPVRRIKFRTGRRTRFLCGYGNVPVMGVVFPPETVSLTSETETTLSLLPCVGVSTSVWSDLRLCPTKEFNETLTEGCLSIS